jgi:hypothetical protein
MSVFDKLKPIRNPLTIVALFAGLAEVFSCLALPRLTPDLQSLFIWFVMLFPSVLVVLFFATLNWNHKVLYAPSDFKSDESFLRTFRQDAERIRSDIRAEGESVRRSAEVFAQVATLSLTNALSPLEKATALTWTPYEDIFDQERRRLQARNNIIAHLKENGSDEATIRAIAQQFDNIILRNVKKTFTGFLHGHVHGYASDYGVRRERKTDAKGKVVEVVSEENPAMRSELMRKSSRECIEPLAEALDYDVARIEQRLKEMELYGGEKTPKILADFRELRDWMSKNGLLVTSGANKGPEDTARKLADPQH